MGRPRVVSRADIGPKSTQVLSHRYDQGAIGCLYLYTTPHVMLDELMTQPIAQGDIFANANTIILMGRTRHEGRYGGHLPSPSTAAAPAVTRSSLIESPSRASLSAELP